MPPLKNTTWLSFLQELREHAIDPGLLEVDDIANLLGIQNHIHPLFQHVVPAIYLLDYTTGKYRIVSFVALQNLGFTRDQFEAGGVDFTISQYHPEDLKLFSEHIFPDRLKFLSTIKPEEYGDYVFSYNYRIQNRKGEYVSLLQRNALIKSDASGKPLLSLGMVINLEHYKNPNTVVQLIEKNNLGDMHDPTGPVLKKTYFLHDEDSLLTRREKELLKYLSDGYSSKQIADKLYLSEHTVIVHRKNMMAKTNTANVAELLSWAIRKEII
jgi:DNA-binding CsgD family transcriptional regulator